VKPDGLDLEVLALLWSLGHVLSSQLHRRFNGQRAMTTTQRRLKRMFDAGWVTRLQFHRPDGGGVPLCYALAPAGLELLVQRGRVDGAGDGSPAESRGARSDADDAARVRRVRREVHAAAWLLAARLPLGDAATLHGGHELVLSPPLRPGQSGPRPLTPDDLRLTGGRTPHDFLAAGAEGRREPLGRFDTVRPDGSVTLSPRGPHESGAELLIDLDDRPQGGAGAARLARYDHMLAGWAAQSPRYRRLRCLPLVVFVCRDAARARECARVADAELLACQAYAGEYPSEWLYPGRARILFAAERDMHAGQLRAVAVPALPPQVRVAAVGGDPAARASDPQPCDIAIELLRGGVLARKGT
jgi:hypothetical protein